MSDIKIGTLRSIRYRIPRELAHSLAAADIENLFVVVAHKRSGHHAVADWILSQFGGMRAHYNYANKFAARDTLDCCDDYWVSGLVDLESISSLRAVSINWENCSMQSPCVLVDILAECSSAFPRVRRKFLIVVVRDAYNNFASCVTRRQQSWSTEIWEDYARLYLGHDLDSLWLGYSVIRIAYNRWFSSSLEKRKVANQIVVDRFLRTHEQVSHFGSGSSFEKLRLDGRASDMKVLERWRLLPYKQLLEMGNQLGEKTHHLNRLIFGAALVDEVLSYLSHVKQGME